MVRYHNRLLQISKDNHVLPRPRERVTVRRLLDGRLQVVYEGQPLRYREIAVDEVVRATEPHRAIPQSVAVRAVHKPGAHIRGARAGSSAGAR